ncbi:hypothetical protein [Komagataeibacter medellinensis]|uniref:hypothetical protein n=1 Tax=Komagataeibacter medellinensis TaxID=1177712 RepID=UPI001E4B3485|nr:hypothetical protein [Komagataeibacter medellinensis]
MAAQSPVNPTRPDPTRPDRRWRGQCRQASLRAHDGENRYSSLNQNYVGQYQPPQAGLGHAHR